MSTSKNIDWFTKIIAVLGLVVACVAIAVSYFQNKNEIEESLSISAKIDMSNGSIKISDIPVATLSGKASDINAILIPWIFTLSNTGDRKLSIISYITEQINQDEFKFSMAGGGATDLNGQPAKFPMVLDSGDSIQFRIHVGFSPSNEIQEQLESLYKQNSRLNTITVFIELAKSGNTIFGGKASYRGGAVRILSTNKNKPTNKIVFKTGRGNEFSIVVPEIMTALGS